MNAIIEVENISKKFRLRTLQSSGGTLRDALASVLRNPFAREAKQKSSENLWALRDVSFQIEPGATLGIVGRNGAGKSTLLKVLSRITRPTGGSAVLRGRVGSLLEIGTGFHPELTGRENIYLNGAVLGMRRREIDRKFDEIVAFSNLEKFLEMPVKHYSSGMYMRLAFAVAAHLEPEILIVDEVLAVGDTEFQRKCLGKMNEVAMGGRTVLFVSHNAAALQRLCSTGIYLERGRLKSFGEMKTVLAQYQADVDAENGLIDAERVNADAVSEGEMRFINWRLIDASTDQPHSIYSREEGVFEFTLVSKRSLENVHFKMMIRDSEDRDLIITHNLSGGVGETILKPGVYKIRWRCQIPLRAGSYKIFSEIYSTRNHRILDLWDASPRLAVLPVSEYDLPEDFQSIVNVPVSFDLQKERM
ncbi:MAG TPA: ABC transporter ATP-binding protein [Pyrinomonadaceae bacterium]|jgi:lipopolysaccharide transport system ATP-binding protein